MTHCLERGVEQALDGEVGAGSGEKGQRSGRHPRKRGYTTFQSHLIATLSIGEWGTNALGHLNTRLSNEF